MIREAIGFGETLDEAKEDAIAKLNASETDEIEFDIISWPRKKVLGIFGGNGAEVKAFIKVEEKKPKAAKKSEKPQRKKEKQPKKEKVAQEEKVKDSKNTELKAANSSVSAVAQYAEPVDASQIPQDSPAGKAVAYIKSVLKAIGCDDVNINVANGENASRISLEGDDLSIIIGRRGETLDSLQYLASLVVNNGGGHYRISLNIGNYREKREETLIVLAKKICEQVLRTGKTRYLEPMNPYERRIIHTAVQGIDGVTSTSFGEGMGRRIAISLEGAEIRPPKINNYRKNGGYSRNAKAKTQQTPSAAREPRRDSDVPLYGKIN